MTQTNGYHIADIPKGVLGEASKVAEEAAEFVDAVEQQCAVMALVELADLYGAMQAYLDKHHPTIGMRDLGAMARVTSRAFTSGARS